MISCTSRSLGSILWDLIEDIMLIERLDTGVTEHELADAGVLPGEFGTRQKPQIVRLGVQQPNLNRVPLDNVPCTLG